MSFTPQALFSDSVESTRRGDTLTPQSRWFSQDAQGKGIP